MAQRTARAGMASSPALRMLAPLQPEKEEAVPTGAGNALGNPAQRSELLTLIFEPSHQHLHLHLLAGELAFQDHTGQRQPWIAGGLNLLGARARRPGSG